MSYYGPSDNESYMLEAQYLRKKALEAQQRQQMQGHKFNTITGGPQLFEQAAKLKESYATAPNAAPQNPMTPGIMNMMINYLGGTPAMAPNFQDRMKRWAQATPSFSMSPGSMGFSDRERLGTGLYEDPREVPAQPQAIPRRQIQQPQATQHSGIGGGGSGLGYGWLGQSGLAQGLASRLFA